MARELLTSKSLESKLKSAFAEAVTKNTRVRIADGDNLNLVVRANGKASWVLDYRLRGVRRPLTLGAWPLVSLKIARELANSARDKVARGIDPLEEKRVERDPEPAPAPKKDTVRLLMEDWLAKHRGSAVYKGNIRAAFDKDVLPAIGRDAPESVGRVQIVEILRVLEGRGALDMLKRVRMWIRHMFEFGVDDETRPELVVSPVPTGHLKSFLLHEPGHFPAITDPDELPKLMRALRIEERPVVRMALLLGAYLWQRPTEIREAKWAEFDVENGVWVIPAERMKKGREHWVPLAPQVREMLRRHSKVVGNAGYLFPGRDPRKAISEATLEVALRDLGFKGRQTMHGFRATATSILVERLHVDERFVEKQLSHEEKNKVKRAYNRAEFWEQRVEMMKCWADWLDKQG